MKKLLCLLLTLCMAASLLPVSASAAGAESLSYTVKNDKIIITACDAQTAGALTIPATIDGLPVVSIRTLAFQNCAKLTSVTLPNSVTSVGYGAFQGCTGLKSITLSTGLTSLAENLFSGCTALTEVFLPANTTSVESSTFAGCTALREIRVDAGNTLLSSADGALYDKRQTVLVTCPAGKTKLSVPQGVQTIGTYAFSGCTKLTEVSLPDSLVTIRGWAFLNCAALQKLVIPESVKTIDDCALQGCAALRDISLPQGLQKLGNAAFYQCSSLPAIELPPQLDVIRHDTFADCTALTSIRLPDGVVKIEDVAFGGCTALRRIAIPAGVTNIGLNAFWNCTALTDVDFHGTKKQWAAITVADGNEALAAATVHYGASGLTIDTQPTSVTIAGGAAATFKVAATGSGLKYQWQFKTPSGDWKNCTSATTGYNTATLKVQGVTGSTNRNGYQYRCIVTDTSGSKVTSSAATLTVKVLKITTQPKAASVMTTAYATFAVKATGAGLKYQWQYLKPNGSWTNCTSATQGYNTATLKVQGVTGSTNRNGYQYRCKVTDSAGNTVTSSAVKLNVLAITTQPKAASVSKSGTATFTVKATGDGMKYQWQFKTPSGDWKNCTSATTGYNTATLKVQGATGSTNRNGYQYRCVIIDAAGSKLTTSAVKLTVK